MNMEIAVFEVDETFKELIFKCSFSPPYNYTPQLADCCLTRVRYCQSIFIS